MSNSGNSSSYVDRSAAAVDYLERMTTQHPTLAETYWSPLSEQLQAKLYHQLTLTMLALLQDDTAITTTADMDVSGLYHTVIVQSGIEDKLHPLAAARMAVLVARNVSTTDPAASLAVLENARERASDSIAILYVTSHHDLLTLMALWTSTKGGFSKETCEDATVLATLDSVQTTLDEHAVVCQELLASGDAGGMDEQVRIVLAAHYQTHMTYHKLVGPADQFYHQALRYIQYAATADTTSDTQLAVDLCLAALTAPDVYDVTNCAQTPCVQALSGSSFAWLCDLVQAVAAGQVTTVATLTQQHAKAMADQPSLHPNVVREKVTLSALVAHLLECPAHERCVHLTDLQATLHLDALDQVEWVVMRACAVGLIKATMDQCEGTVNVTWVTPMALTVPQLTAVAESYGLWATKAEEVRAATQRQASTLLA